MNIFTEKNIVGLIDQNLLIEVTKDLDENFFEGIIIHPGDVKVYKKNELYGPIHKTGFEIFKYSEDFHKKVIDNIDWSKSHCGVILCTIYETYKLMPEVKPVIEELIESGKLEFNPSEYLVDVKIHMLMADQFPCIPDWHCDFVPRNNETKLKEPERITGEKMYLWVSGEPRTEFKVKPKTIQTENFEWVEFTQNDYHRGVKSTTRTWRCFIRLVPKCLVDGRPTGNKDTTHRGSLRRHSQVYLDANSFEW